MSIDASTLAPPVPAPARFGGNSPSTMRRVAHYYETTTMEYRLVLALDKHKGIHYGYYDDEHRTYTQASQNMTRHLAGRAGLRPGMRVLDAGCGIGGSSIWLARNADVDVTGITITPSQRETADGLARRHDVADRTRFLLRDYCNTGFPAQSFDVIWALESVCYADDKQSFIREARRLLRPGGRLVLADGFFTRDGYSRSERLLLHRWLDGWAVHNLESVDGFRAGLDAEGFQSIQVENITPRVLPFAETLRMRALMLSPIAELLLWLGAWKKVQVDNGKAAVHQYEALRRNLWCYCVFVADV